MAKGKRTKSVFPQTQNVGLRPKLSESRSARPTSRSLSHRSVTTELRNTFPATRWRASLSRQLILESGELPLGNILPVRSAARSRHGSPPPWMYAAKQFPLEREISVFSGGYPHS